MEDEEIVELYWDRKESALTETQNKYGKYLFDVAYVILCNAQDAEECVNDTYFAAWNSIPPTKPEHLMSYLSKISKNAAMNRVKYYNAQKRKGYTEPLYDKEYGVEMQNDSTDAREESKTINSTIHEFVRGLNDEKSVIFIRRFRDNESIKDIAAELNFTESKVKMTLLRLKLRLKERLEAAEIYI